MIARGWSALLSVSMLVLLVSYLVAANRIEANLPAGRVAVLAVTGSAPATAEFTTRVAEARDAVVIDPLNQRLVNVAMLAATRARPAAPAPGWFDVLGKLGWRDTPARQNLLIRHALTNNIPALLNDVDGLLRRNQLIDQLTPVLLATEADPMWRSQVVARLRQRPAWRFGYLQRGSLIDDRPQLAARADTIRLLQRSDHVSAGEIAPILPKLLATGLGREAFAIWRSYEPSIASPVADPHFAGLAAEQEPSTVPFHWQLTNGSDYAVDAIARPVSQLTVSWNGTGTPVFASQYLSKSAGRYAVVLTGTAPQPQLTETIGVRMVCGSDIVDFTRQRELSPVRVAYIADRAVPCAFPRLELFGLSGGTDLQERQVAISDVAIVSSV